MELTFRINIDGKEGVASLQLTEKEVSNLKKTITSASDEMAKWGMITTGFKQAIDSARDAVNVFKGAVMDAAAEKAMRENFKGSAEDLELFRKATANTVTEGNLLRLSNQATDLGVSFKTQALLLALATQISLKLGIGIEEAFQRIVYASEGSTRGMRTIGIQVAEYNKIVNDMLKAQGETVTSIDPEILKRIRLEAIIKQSGITIADVTNKSKAEIETLKGLGVIVEESKEKFGNFINQGLVPVINKLTESGDASKIMVGGLVTIVEFAVPLIPILTQLRTAQKLLEAQTLFTADALGTETVAVGTLATTAKGASKILGTIAIVAAAVWEAWNIKKQMILEERKEAEKNAADLGKLLEHSPEYSKASQEQNIPAKKAELEIEKEILALTEKRKALVPRSPRWIEINKEIEALQKLIAWKKTDDNEDLIRKELDVRKARMETNEISLKDYQAYLFKRYTAFKASTDEEKKQRAEILKDLEAANKLLFEKSNVRRGPGTPEEAIADAQNNLNRKRREVARGKQIEEELDFQKEMENLRADAVVEEKAHALAELDKWKEQELIKWGKTEEAKTAITEAYAAKLKAINEKYFQDNNLIGYSLLQGLQGMSNTFWDEFIIGGRQAKDGWDALWLGFRNSALKAIGDISIQKGMKALMDFLAGRSESPVQNIIPQKNDEGGGINFLDIAKFGLGFLPFLATGGIATSPRAAVVGDVPEAIIPLDQLNQYVSMPQIMNINFDNGLGRQFGDFVAEIRKWQRELSFKMDAFELRAGVNLAENIYNKFAVTGD